MVSKARSAWAKPNRADGNWNRPHLGPPLPLLNEAHLCDFLADSINTFNLYEV